jgi:hypothetical protein
LFHESIDLYHVADILARNKRFFPASLAPMSPRVLTGKNKVFILLGPPHNHGVIKGYYKDEIK